MHRHICILISRQKSVKLGWLPPKQHFGSGKRQCTEGAKDEWWYVLTRKRNQMAKKSRQQIFQMTTLNLTCSSWGKIIKTLKSSFFNVFFSRHGSPCFIHLFIMLFSENLGQIINVIWFNTNVSVLGISLNLFWLIWLSPPIFARILEILVYNVNLKWCHFTTSRSVPSKKGQCSYWSQGNT